MAKKEKATKKYNLNVSKIIVSPWVTEKSSILASENKYVFLVAADANKSEVKKAIVNLYEVNPVKVNILNIKGDKVFRAGRLAGFKKDIKKAIVTLKEGDTIDILG